MLQIEKNKRREERLVRRAEEYRLKHIKVESLEASPYFRHCPICNKVMKYISYNSLMYSTYQQCGGKGFGGEAGKNKYKRGKVVKT